MTASPIGFHKTERRPRSQLRSGKLSQKQEAKKEKDPGIPAGVLRKDSLSAR
jgi:hypothetical protein